MVELSVEWLAILALVALVAGFIDAIAGGGGLLTIPALLLAGLNPVQAIATNKLQACFGSFTATRFFVKQALVVPSNNYLAIVMVALGAGIGSWLIQRFDSQLLLNLMPYVLIVIALYLVLVPSLGQAASAAKLSNRAFATTVLPSVGAYDGFFGPGTGTFFTLGYSQLRGLDLLSATAHAKLLNFTTNVVSLTVFILSGQVLWLVGLSMALGQALGARLGAATAFKQGTSLIRWLTVVVCIAISVSLLWR